MTDTPPPYPTALSGPSHRILPAEDGTRIVVFLGAKDLAEGRFNFLQLGGELGESRVFLNNGGNDWYQGGIEGIGDTPAAVCDTLRRWQEAMGAQEIVLIGTSMGGYGAIQYAAALGARALAFSSDATLGAPLSRSAAHFSGAAAPTCPDLPAALAGSGARITLFAGERDASDLQAASLLAAAEGVTATTLLGIDHYVPSTLSRQSRLGPLIRAFVAGAPLPAAPDAGAALTRPGYIPALRSAQLAEAARDWPRAEAEARAALAAYPGGEAAEMILGWSLVQQDRPAEAADVLARALAGQPADTETAIRLAVALRGMGAVERAGQIYRRILADRPGDHQSHYALGILALRRGDLHEARAAVLRALRLSPRNTTYRSRLADLDRRLAARG